MKKLIKPVALKKGDSVATISLSWGGASIFKKRYEQGKQQFENAFGVKIVETSHALSSADDLYNHPQWRLNDLMEALEDKSIKGILCNIGGDDTIRLLPYMTDKHFQTIYDNPKIFLGMSDTTINHLMFFKAGVGSFYSPCTLFGYAENGGIDNFMIENTKKTIFDSSPIGLLPESKNHILERVDWGNDNIVRTRTLSSPWRYIQGSKTVRGRLIGGCFDSLMLCVNGTSLFPPLEEFEDAVLFLENSEDKPSPVMMSYFLRTLGIMGILERIKGILFARPGGEFLPQDETEKIKWVNMYTEFDETFIRICKEFNREDLPIVTNMDFGHTVPQLIFPYGAMVEINPINRTVAILESAVK